jgi:RNA polymerase Rpb1, domain 5/RNA polymerase Rpb1, domain 4
MKTIVNRNIMNKHKKITFYNQVMNRSAMRQMIGRLVAYLGNDCTARILDQLKILGFRYATQTGISLGIDDLLTTPSKGWLIQDAENQARISINQCSRGSIHAVEKLRQVVETWHITSEHLKHEMSPNFKITDPLNPVHMMSFSGARGSASQVHQLVGMRGLMSDPQGQIIDLPIQSNLREGLSLTEYIISCYGARKGVVDTAIRTADAGYLTRRLVEVAQHIVIRNLNCDTKEGIHLEPIKSYSSSGVINLSLEERLIGRVVAKTLTVNNRCVVIRNQDIGAELANRLNVYKYPNLLIRSPLTCANMPRVCRLCYGWDLSYGHLVELGEAIGIVAGQSIGEPGTQLTLRTFHTGGVFSGDVAEHVRAPFNGIVSFESSSIKPTRNRHGRPAWICCNTLQVIIQGQHQSTVLNVPVHSFLLVRKLQFVESRQIIAEVRSTASPLKEKVSKGTYSDIQGEVFFHTSFFDSIVSPLLRKILKLTPIYARYLWVISCQLLIYSSLKKIYFLYQDQDHVQTDLPLGRSISKNRKQQCLRNTQMGLIQISRYHISSLNKQRNYQWLLIISPKDQFKIKSLSINENNNDLISNDTNRAFNQTQNNIKLFSLEEKSPNDLENLKMKLNRVSNRNNVFFQIKDFKYNTINKSFKTKDCSKGLLGRLHQSFQSTFQLKLKVNQILIDSLNCHINPQLFQQKMCSYFESNIFFLSYEDFTIYKYLLKQKLNPILTFTNQTCLTQTSFMFNLGKFLSQEIICLHSKYISVAGRIINMNHKYDTLQVAKPYLTMPKASIYVYNKEPIPEGKTLLSLIYERLRTSDITQGLPKAEQLLEARPNNEVSINLQQYFEEWTKRIKKHLLLPYSVFTPKLVQHSQIDLVNRIQAVYLAQGVYTADKHIEVIVRQMTSKVLVVEHIDPTAISPEGVIRWSLKCRTYKMCLYLPGELIQLKQAQRIHRALQEPLPYRPLLLGVTKASLNTESFISEASFERTANVLSKSAFEGRIDWMKGLKENIIFGGMIPAGTGCPEQYWETTFQDVPKLKSDIQKSFFIERTKPKICYRVNFPYLNKGKLHDHLRQSVYINYNYQKYSITSERNEEVFMNNSFSNYKNNNEIFLL